MHLSRLLTTALSHYSHLVRKMSQAWAWQSRSEAGARLTVTQDMSHGRDPKLTVLERTDRHADLKQWCFVLYRQKPSSHGKVFHRTALAIRIWRCTNDKDGPSISAPREKSENDGLLGMEPALGVESWESLPIESPRFRLETKDVIVEAMFYCNVMLQRCTDRKILQSLAMGKKEMGISDEKRYKNA